MKIRLGYALFFIAFLMFVSGCAHKDTQVRSAQDIFKEARELAQKGKVDKASEMFMEVRTYYPGDELAKKSLLETGDLYYNNELYESALQSYEEFRLLYPTDPEAGYSLYRIALCHFNQMNTLDRDQSESVRAIQTFENYLSSYPDSPYAQAAKDQLVEAKTLLASHYVYIGKFYLKKKDNKAACNRFQYVKKQYPGISLEDDLDALISQSCKADEPQPAPKP